MRTIGLQSLTRERRGKRASTEGSELDDSLFRGNDTSVCVIMGNFRSDT
jgi:hypothetical protein